MVGASPSSARASTWSHRTSQPRRRRPTKPGPRHRTLVTSRRPGCPVVDRLPAPLVHQDGGTDGVQPVLEEAEVVGAPEQRTALQHHSLDQRTSRAAVTPVSGRQGPGGLLVERSLHLGYPFATVWRSL